MKLWLVRHAQPLVAPGLCYGRTDLPADEPATAQAARALAKALPQGLAVLCSPLQRCEQLSKHLRWQRPDLLIKTDARLAEMDFGSWESRPWDSIALQEYQAWLTDFAHYRVGGGECVQGFMQRVQAALWQTLKRAAASGGSAGGEAVWITHAGVVRAVQLLAQGVQQVADAQQWPRDAPACGQWTVLDIAPTRAAPWSGAAMPQ